MTTLSQIKNIDNERKIYNIAEDVYHFYLSFTEKKKYFQYCYRCSVNRGEENPLHVYRKEFVYHHTSIVT